MPNENEIIAIFKADIEQYKAKVEEMSKVNATASTTTDAVTKSTDTFSKKSKGAASSIGTLSKGLSGVVGLLGITGRLFGVNTDKIEALIFASKGFVKVGQDIIKAQKLATAATIANTAATAASTTATTAQTVAERILNAVRTASLAGIGLVVAGVTALVAIVYSYVTSLKEEEKAMKRKQDVDKEQIKINNQLAESFNKRAKQQDETALAEGVRTGLITERQAKEIALNEKFFKQRAEDDKLIAQQRLDAAKNTNDAFGRLTIADQTRIEANRVKLLKAAEDNFQTELTALREEFAKEDAEKQKKANEKAEAENKASLDRQFNAFVKYHDQKDAELQKRINKELEEQKKFEENKQKLIEDEFVEEQNSAAKNREIGKAATKKRLEEEKELNNQRIEDAQQVASAIFSAFEQASDKRQELLDKEITQQEKNIDVQRDLAARGLENTLAFEQKRAADLQRQQQKEAQQAKRVKLLETFLNSLAEFSKTDPKTALQKALLQVALAQAATAVFAEEGGIIGEIGERSNLRRKHKGGGDVLLHAQTGEGILSRREMDNLGRRNFHLLKDAARFPVREDVFAMPQLAIAGGMQPSNADVVKELRLLRSEFKNQPREKLDINKYGEYIHTVTQDGITTATKGKLKKNRFKA